MYEFLFRYRYPLFILLLLLILLFILAQTGQIESENRLQQVIHTINSPFQKGLNALIRSIKSMWEDYIILVDLHQENRQLHEQISELKQKLNQSREEAVQYRRLRGQLLFAKRQSDEKVLAEIIGESVDNLHQIRLLNRGSTHGLKRNYSAILKEGLVGRIQSVSSFQSVLQLITDFRSRVPALLQRNREKGLIFGTQEGLEMRQIKRRIELKIGDRVITSGLGGMFPKGILIGTVFEFEKRSHELFQTAFIEPSVEFSSMEEVFIIISGPYQLGKPLFAN